MLPGRTSVCIVGGGPFGLMLANELGRRGIALVLVDAKPGTTENVQANATQARTMEHYRRLGFADEVRGLGMPPDFPTDIAVQRRAPYEARADAIMYRQELAQLAYARDWEVHLYDAKAVVDQAAGLLADRADEVLHGPRATMGPPWTKDHRIALAATIVAG